MTDEPDLFDLLGEAVDDVQPRDRLPDILARAHQSQRRGWAPALAVAAAAVVAIAVSVAVVEHDRADRVAAEIHDESASGDADDPRPQPTESTPPTPEGTTDTVAMAVYYVGDTPQGPRLFREFRATPAAPDAPLTALNAAVVETPYDPDYRSAWDAVTIGGVSSCLRPSPQTHGAILVDLAAVPSELPGTMSADEARLALQQLVFTVQAGLQTRAPVQFRIDGKTATTVLGVDVSGPVSHDPDVLALVNVTEPEMGTIARGSVLDVSGVANSFEATVPWEIRTVDGQVRESGFVTARGSGDRLYPWADHLDISALPPGDYVFVASTDDPAGGAGPGPTHDSKSFTIAP